MRLNQKAEGGVQLRSGGNISSLVAGGHLLIFNFLIPYPILKNTLPGVFPVNFVHLSGHNARIAPSEINEIPSKIHRPGFNILCGMGSE